MAIINCSLDTSSKIMTVTIDGQAMPAEVAYFSASQYSYDGDKSISANIEFAEVQVDDNITYRANISAYAEKMLTIPEVTIKECVSQAKLNQSVAKWLK